jgi:HD-GYP domain-containing protein (c-di-GMP phosphodiesterase class II)
MAKQRKAKTLSQALTANVRKYGTAIVSNLAISVKTTQLYSFAHQNVVNAIRELEEYLTSFLRLEGEAELSMVEGFLFINEVRVKVEFGGMQTYEFVQGILAERKIGNVSFLPGVQRGDISKFVEILTQPVANQDVAWEGFESAFKSAGITNIAVSKYELKDDRVLEVVEDRRMIAISLYFRAIHQTQEAFAASRDGKRINLKKIKRTIQALVDTLIEDEPTLLALVNIKNHLSYVANHSVNVMILSMALSLRLGFHRKSISDLGIAALLHDVGKSRVRPEIAEVAREGLAGTDLTELDDHVFNGVDILLSQRIVDSVVKSMNVAFLHHFRFDSTGYPRTHLVRGQNFFSRIVAICDQYDNRTTQRKGSEQTIKANEVMKRFLDGSGTEFDPLIVKAFVNLLGLYPIGSLVCLDDGCVGTVVAPSRNARFLDRPTVKIFLGPRGESRNETVDLLERDGSTFRRSILKLYQQEEVQLEMEEFLSVI